MKDKKFEDYENLEIIPEDIFNQEIEFNTDEEISELKDILIFEEKQNEKE